MSIYNDPNLIRAVISDHFENPRNKGLIKQDDRYKSCHLHSASCIDDFHLQVLLEDANITDLRFEGIGCAISTASTSILTSLLKGKSIEEAKNIIAEYMQMIYGKEYQEEMLEEAVVFQNVHRQASRIKCATITWNGLLELLK